jgi:diguanylate cyclase (GGDEF)-like protein
LYLPVPLVLIVGAAGLVALLILRRRWRLEREALRRAAFSDHLTGLANRPVLLHRIGYEIDRHRRARRRFALVMLDLDGFKVLNDRFGHAAGDELLREVARALQETVRAQDTAARIGGDEFCVLAPETHGPGAEQLVARLLVAVARVTAGIDAVSASAGLAVFPDDGTATRALLEAADRRLIAAKARQRGGRLHRAA